MYVTLAILVIAAVGLIGLYYLFPGKLLDLFWYLMRRSSRLRLHTVRVDGDDWPCLMGGPETAQVLVLLHGFGADKDNWTPYARHFTREYRVIAPDLPGFGDNFKDPDRQYDVAAQATRLHAFLRAAGVSQQFHLGGNSMGGYIALEYALSHPDRLLSLTLLDNAGVLSANKSEVQLALDRGENPFAMNAPEDMERLFRLAVYKPMYIPAAFIRVMFEKASKQQAFLETVQRTMMAEIDTGEMNRKLPAVATPTLIIWGRHDRLVDVSTVDVLSALIPDSRSVVMEETGHVPMLESPAETAAHHLDFLKRVSSATRHPGRELPGALP